MDEAKRFTRIVMPGALFGVETTILLWIILPSWVEAQLKIASSVNGLGFAIAGLLGSGAMGFVFSAIHHGLHWTNWLSAIDHTNVVRGLIKSNKIVCFKVDQFGVESPLDPPEVQRDTALEILSALWHGAIHRPPLKGADPKVSSLSDITHSVGTARIASMAAMVAAVVIASHVGTRSFTFWPVLRFVAAMCVGSLAVVLFWKAYLRMGRMTQFVINQVFLDAVSQGVLPRITRRQID